MGDGIATVYGLDQAVYGELVELDTGCLLYTSREQGAEVETDLAGDVISSINSASPFRVLLCGHIDEIGFRVTHITDDGYLQVGKAGGIRLALAQGKRVTVLGRKRLTGVMGLLLRNGEVRTDIELTDLYIDCGFTSRAEALEPVSYTHLHRGKNPLRRDGYQPSDRPPAAPLPQAYPDDLSGSLCLPRLPYDGCLLYTSRCV